MRINLYALLTLLIITLAMTTHGGKYPVDVFSSPVKRDFKLSGTFGELRSNHFHAGLDIKASNGVDGDPIYASYEGFVSRIKVEEYGYGNALYIEHPNGFTTVYAHLLEFTPEIAAYVKQEQYKRKSFVVDLYPNNGQFPLVQEQRIGAMGNTGSSGGAHLHFEIRHTAGQIPINPLHFGFNLSDQKYPVIQELLVYAYDAAGNLIQTIEVNPRYKSNREYIIEKPLNLTTSKIAFGLRTYDSQDGSNNHNGIYSLECKVDNEPSFAFSMDEISFRETRYLNAHIDYEKKVSEGQYYHRCYPLEGNKLPIYYTSKDRGFVYLNSDTTRHINLTVGDFKGNTSTLSFDVKRNLNADASEIALPPCELIADPAQVNIISKPGIQIVWPSNCFYERTPLSLVITPADSLKTLSPYFSVSPFGAAVHYYFDVNIEGLGVPKNLLDKAFIARCEKNKNCVSCGGHWIGNNLTAAVRQMSTYTIMVDTIPPEIRTLKFGSTMTGWTKMAFKISDNFKINDRGRDLLYEGYVDGEWILFSLDGKTGTLTHLFDGQIPPGDHTLMLKVIDDRGNETVFKKSFTL